MKIAVAQTRPEPGLIDANVRAHLRLARAASEAGAGLLAFPELSLTGYEPTGAAALAISAEDPGLEPLRAASARYRIALAVGAPTTSRAGVHISTILFRPDGSHGTWSKHHLHADERPHFAPGPPGPNFLDDGGRIALAICYEISVPQHARAARSAGAAVYLASVAKSGAGIGPAHERLAGVAREHALMVLMANCVGVCDGAACAGRSAAWDADGARLAQLDDRGEAVLVLDTSTRQATSRRPLA